MASKLLQFSEYDLSNAAMVPHILQQLVSKINDHSDWIRARAELVNVQARLKKNEETIVALEHEIDMLRAWTAKLCFKEDHDKLALLVRETETEFQEKISGVELRLEEISDLRNSIEGQQKSIITVSSRLDRTNGNLEAQDSLLKQHKLMLDNHFSMHEEHVHMLSELKENNSARIQDIKKVNDCIIKESKRSDERANRLEQRIDKGADDLIQVRNTMDQLDKENRARLDISRREAAAELAAAGARLSTNILSVKMEMEHGDKKLETAVNKASKSLADQQHRSVHEFNEKLLRAAREAEARAAQLGERIEAEAARALEHTDQGMARARAELVELRSLSELRFKQLDAELRSNVEVLKATIRSAIGPELRDMVQREAFDLTQRMLGDHYQSIRVLLDSKVDFAVAGEILKKKADAMELGAFTRKADVDAMIAAALAASGPRPAGGAPRPQHADVAAAPTAAPDAGRLDQLEREIIRLGQRQDQIHQMFKNDRRARAADGPRLPQSASNAVARLDKVLLAKSFRDVYEARGPPQSPRAATAQPGPRPPGSGQGTPGRPAVRLTLPLAAPQSAPDRAGGEEEGPGSGRSALSRAVPVPSVRLRVRGSLAVDSDAALECSGDIVSQYRGGTEPGPGGDGRGPWTSRGPGDASNARAAGDTVPGGLVTDDAQVAVSTSASARLLLHPQANGRRRSPVAPAAPSPRLWFK